MTVDSSDATRRRNTLAKFGGDPSSNDLPRSASSDSASGYNEFLTYLNDGLDGGSKGGKMSLEEGVDDADDVSAVSFNSNYEEGEENGEKSYQEQGGIASEGVRNRRMRVSAMKRNLFQDYYDLKHEEDSMELPSSTHTLLHTEPIGSIAFLFSLGIAVLSAMCLILVLVNVFKEGKRGNWFSVPTGISPSVRAAQYCGIFVGVLMEEEIPQALILMRAISLESFNQSYPDLSYTRFILSCVLRLFMGYLFLTNLFVTIVQADDVITIFFDILALEFVQHLDDMAFELGRKDILGRNLKVATSIEYKVLTRTGLDRKKSKKQDEEDALIPQSHVEENSEEWNFYCFRRRKKHMGFRWILKATYFVNLAFLVVGTIIVGERQKNHSYHCKSVTVSFGDGAFEKAFTRSWRNSSQPPEQKTVIYSYFNGVYRITKRDSEGYPVYTEMNKNAGEPYQNTIGAEIIHCPDEEAWVFRHEYISKHKSSSQNGCQEWLFRSPQTKVFDLTDAPQDDWFVWTGIITPGNKVSIICNECEKASDCNYNGECGEDGKCQCNPGFSGLTWNQYFEEDQEGLLFNLAVNSKNETLSSYMRPIYRSPSFSLSHLNLNATTHTQDVIPSDIVYTDDYPTDDWAANADWYDSWKQNIPEGAEWFASLLVYSGSRWYGTEAYGSTQNFDLDEYDESAYGNDYHAFWDNLYEGKTSFISDPITGVTPVGADFYIKHEHLYQSSPKWEDYGPFGLLYPVYNISGKGYFHCYGTNLTAVKVMTDDELFYK